MANYYTEFSVTLPKVDPEQLAAFMALMEDMRKEEEEEEEEGIWGDAVTLSGLSYEQRDGELWIYAENGEGNVDNAADLIQKFLVNFNITGGIYMGWASYCDRPRVNEAGGGGVVVTATDRLWVSSDQVISLAIGKEILVLNNPGYA